MKDNTLIFQNQIANSAIPISKYSLAEKIAYLSMIASVAWADGSIDSDELDTIADVANRAGLDSKTLDAVVKDTKDYDSEKFLRWAAMISTTDLKYRLLADMFVTAFADNKVMESESVYMSYVAEKLGISKDYYDLIRTNVEVYRQVKKQCKPVVYEPGPVNASRKDGVLVRGVKNVLKAINAFF